MENNIQANQSYQRIHFIISYIKSKKIELSIKEKSDSDYINYLQKVKTTETKSFKNITYEIAIYNFKLYLNKIKNEEKIDKITIILKDENHNMFEAAINIYDIEEDKDCFLYNFNFEPIKKFLNIGIILPPSSLLLLDSEKFDLYTIYIKEDNLTEKDKEKKIKDLVYYTQKIFLDKKENHLLYFYANIFSECYKDKNACLNHIKMFNIDMFNLNEIIAGSSAINDKINETIDSLITDISLIFNYIDKNEKEEKSIKQNIVNFFFYYSYFYQRREINKILENDDIKTYCYNILIFNEKSFQDLKLNKKSLNILIKICQSIEQIKTIFSFDDDFLDLLEIANENFEHICQLYNNLIDRIKAKSIIKYKQFVKPVKNDNIEEIFNQIKMLLRKEVLKKTFIFKFNSCIFNKYLEINSETNLNEIITIYNISKYIKRNDQLSKMKNNSKILNILHNKGLYFIEQHKLNNSEILNYLENDDYYINSSNTKVFLNILNNFDINSINSDFLIRWKKVNWAKRYKNNKILFYEKISNLIKDMKNFGYLFELFDINKRQRDYEKDCLNIMEQKYKKLYLDKFDKNQHFINQTVDLIYYSEIKNYDITSLIKECLFKDKKNNIDSIDDIFKKLIQKEKQFSEKLTDIIVDFFNDNILKSDIMSFKYLINNLKAKRINSDIAVFLNDYILTKDDIFSMNKTNNYKIFEILRNNNFLLEENLGDCLYYISYLALAFKITDDFDNLKIEYNYINQFYIEKKENNLYERLSLIMNDDKNKINKYKEDMDECLNNINCILNDFQYIISFLKFFFPETQKENIEKIERIINDIKFKNINYYKSIYDFYLAIKNEYLKEAEKFYKLKNNNLIIDLNNNLKKINNNEVQNYSNIKDFIEIMKIILEENTLKSKKIESKKAEKLFSFLKISKQDLSKEINLLAQLLDIKNEIDTDKIIEEIFYLAKKPKLIKLIEILIFILDSFEVRKTYYYSFLKIMHEYLISTKGFSVIKLSKNIIEKFGFNIDEKNKFENLLLNLSDRKEEKEFLFDKKNHRESFLRLKIINDERNNNLEGFDKIFLFISKYMQYKGDKTDKQIINDIKNDINSNENLESYFENYFNKFKLLKENFIK